MANHSSHHSLSELLAEDVPSLLEIPIDERRNIIYTQQSQMAVFHKPKARKSVKIDNSKSKAEMNDEGHHKFLMDMARNASKDMLKKDASSLETFEIQRAERALFVQELMVATLQQQPPKDGHNLMP